MNLQIINSCGAQNFHPKASDKFSYYIKEQPLNKTVEETQLYNNVYTTAKYKHKHFNVKKIVLRETDMNTCKGLNVCFPYIVKKNVCYLHV